MAKVYATVNGLSVWDVLSSFGYKCVGCGEFIKHGDNVILKHIRHGQVLGETKGTYNSKGGVLEDPVFCGSGDKNNSFLEKKISEFYLPDSGRFNGRQYKGKPVCLEEFAHILSKEGIIRYPFLDIFDHWNKLEPYMPPEGIRSGTEAWHNYCYSVASDEVKEKHIISEWYFSRIGQFGVTA